MMASKMVPDESEENVGPRNIFIYDVSSKNVNENEYFILPQ